MRHTLFSILLFASFIAGAAEYALVDDQDTILDYRKFDSAPVDPAGKPWRWLPVIVTDPVKGDNQIKEGPVVTVNPADVTRVWTVRDKTAQELDDENTTKATIKIEAEDIATHKIIFQLVNDVRALEGKQPITPQQYKDYYKGLL